ncbi:MAG TPA: hypothetical protein VMG40_06830, partial [Bryobacteraceae bacterium]|nr:hypothetical protein [Bryobacteraceae bacterium]
MVIPRMSRPATAKPAEIEPPSSSQRGTSEPRFRKDAIPASEADGFGGNAAARDFTDSKPEMVPPAKPSRAAPGGRVTRTMLAAALIVLVAIGAVFAYNLTRSAIPRPSQPAARPPGTQRIFAAAPLQLQVERRGNGLSVHWNPASRTVAKAREGRLTIVENGNTRVIPLSAQQLIRGHVYYQPSADQVEFTLEVVDDSGASTEEFVLALSSKTNKSVQSIPLARPTADPAANKRKPEEDDVARSSPKTFKLPPAKQNAMPAAPTVIQDAPPVVKLDGTPPNNLPVGRISAPQLTAVAPAPAQVLKTPAVNPSAAPEIKAPVRVAPTYQTAVAKKKTSPVLPASI